MIVCSLWIILPSFLYFSCLNQMASGWLQFGEFRVLPLFDAKARLQLGYTEWGLSPGLACLFFPLECSMRILILFV